MGKRSIWSIFCKIKTRNSTIGQENIVKFANRSQKNIVNFVAGKITQNRQWEHITKFVNLTHEKKFF